jgi:hypothetical protein
MKLYFHEEMPCDATRTYQRHADKTRGNNEGPLAENYTRMLCEVDTSTSSITVAVLNADNSDQIDCIFFPDVQQVNYVT